MGMQLGGRDSLNNDPNLVPMIDVLLVLLVIFMLMVPMKRRVIEVQLPDPKPTPSREDPSQQIVLEVIPGDVYRINTEPVAKDVASLSKRLHEIYDQRPVKVMYVKGDPGVKYQDVITVMDVARGAGVRVLGFTPVESKGSGS